MFINALLAMTLLLSFAVAKSQSSGALNSVIMMMSIYLLSAIQMDRLNLKLFPQLFTAYFAAMALLGILVKYQIARFQSWFHVVPSPFGADHYTGIASNPNQAGIFIAAGLLLILVFKMSDWAKVLVVTASVPLLLATNCRSAIVGLGAGLFVYGVICQFHRTYPSTPRHKLAKLLTAQTLLVPAALILGFIFLITNDRLFEKIRFAGSNARITLWQSVLENFSARGLTSILFGSGPGSTLVEIDGTLGSGVTSHSAFVQLLSDYGLLCFIFCMLHLGAMFIFVPKSQRARFSIILAPALLIGCVETQLFVGSSFLWLSTIVAYHICCQG